MNAHTNANLLETCSDELERLVLEEVHKRRRSSSEVAAAIMPVGRAELSLELARLGCQVTACDTAERESDFLGRALAAGRRDQVRFVAADLGALPDALDGEPFDILVCQHQLYRLPYADASRALRRLLRSLRIGGKLYISTLGMHSELGDQYEGANLPVEERFCSLHPDMARKYGIATPVCLYSERNLIMLLLTAGASVLRSFTSTYGTVKAVAVRV